MRKIPNLLLATIILSISNIIVRGLGFIYKIFLSNIIGEQGLGIYHIVFNFLMICIALTTTGIPTALSCLISANNSLKNKKQTNILFISTLYVSFFIAFFISIFVSLNNEFFADKFLHNPDLGLFILSICPAIVLITLSNVLRSYFYGIKKVIVPAIGQVLEQTSRILFLVLIYHYIKNDGLICYSALIAISVGEAINIIFITVNLYEDSNLYKKFTINIKDFRHASFETLKMSVPITCNKMSSIVLQSISSIIIPSRLILANMSYSQALGAYGIISGMVMPFVYLPFSVGSALVVNLIPSISGEVALKNNNILMKKITYSIGLTLFVSILCSGLFFFFGNPLCLLFFKNETAGIYLKTMCLAPIFLSLNQTLSAILHGIRKEFISSFNTILGMVIQLIFLYFLLPIPSLNIYAYIYVVTGAAMFTTLLHSIALIHALKSSAKII
ncbi:oligosaccharide flippase family protein [Intestinibacter bartlettii]|uniref:Oligosaccharide flippase family protein n=1 Tax=Intestinibacter bartlettii TaxID=261299 RepID=A0ABS6DYS4_9FIRM|nr:oligosaccharide flippase family protein [Intestinibacter bartlettii]MBU5337001.1 oligosaccharide flippase family protein [Intestinibacter bartlettii]MDO5011368.1 oligosaccharide flippase family protein [Intestinibacter bartlettii]